MKTENINSERRGFLKKILGVTFAGTLFSEPANALTSGKWENINSAKGNKSLLTGEDPYLGEISIVAFDFAPRNWAKCDGGLLPINANQALFSLLGTTYGGNGQTNFALPDFRGKSPMHAGNGFIQGQTGGESFHTISSAEMPQHYHTIAASSNFGTSENPAGLVPAKNSSTVPQYSSSAVSSMAASAVTNVGGGQAHNNMPPYFVLNFVIALSGVFPSRN